MTLRRQIRLLRLYAILNSLVVIVLATTAFRQASPQTLDEISVHRIDVVDTDGTLRMVISNKDRMHPGVMDGITIERTRQEAGMIFFNDQGDEVGGLTYAGRETNGTRQADAGLMFDQLKQDQTVGLTYTEGNGRRTAGLQVWDRPDTHLSELIKQMNAANTIQDPAAHKAALDKIRSSAQPGPRRVFVGKNAEKAATVTLADANGKTRIAMTVDATGNPRLEFLDETGRVISRLPAAQK